LKTKTTNVLKLTKPSVVTGGLGLSQAKKKKDKPSRTDNDFQDRRQKLPVSGFKKRDITSDPTDVYLKDNKAIL
jgi:hypothetical protein